MPPVGDERDLASAAEWGLGPPVEGHFPRTTVELWLMLVVPFSVSVALLFYFFPPTSEAQWWINVLAPFALGGTAVFGTMAMRAGNGRATAIQVGLKGISVCQRTWIRRTLLRSAWILWKDLRLDPKGLGDRFARSVHMYQGDDGSNPMLVDYVQLRAILLSPNSRGSITEYPIWLERELGLPRTQVVTRPWGQARFPTLDETT